MRELNYAPRLIAAFLAGLNGIAMNIVFVKCQQNYPDFLRLPYFIVCIVVIVTGYALLAYSLYGFLRVYILKDTSLMHHEMEEEDDYNQNNYNNNKEYGHNGNGPIKSHLKEQKEMNKKQGMK